MVASMVGSMVGSMVVSMVASMVGSSVASRAASKELNSAETTVVWKVASWAVLLVVSMADLMAV